MGLQTLDRAVAVLRLLASAGQGLRLTDVQQALELSKPTAHRLLGALVTHGLAAQDGATRRYRLGPAIDALHSGRGPADQDLGRLSEASVFRLAEASQDTVFVMGRDRLDTVCLARESGSYPIRAITVEVGTRRPLGVGAGGLSILGALPAEEAHRIVAALAMRLQAQPLTSAAQVKRSSDQARRLGYALSDDQVARGVRGLAVCVRSRTGVPMAAIGIAAISERMRPNRIMELVELLRQERAVIEALLAKP
jgi:DNA-binding IclR family transcriptional regulator